MGKYVNVRIKIKYLVKKGGGALVFVIACKAGFTILKSCAVYNSRFIDQEVQGSEEPVGPLPYRAVHVSFSGKYHCILRTV